MGFLKALWAAITLKAWRAANLRRRYEEIRTLIVKEHHAGRGGMIVPKKFDLKDLMSFKPPMYHLARNEKKQLCLFWRKELMSEEVGPPLPASNQQARGATAAVPGSQINGQQ